MATIDIKTLGRSSMFGIVAELWRIGSRFVLSPVIIAAVGLEGYGTWTLVFSVAAYLSTVNTSFGIAYSRYTAECARTEEWERLGRICAAGMVSLGALALAAFVTSFWWGAPVLRALELPAELLDDAAIALWIVFGVLVLRMSVGAALEVLAGLQRIDLTYRIGIVGSIVEFVVVLPLLYAGYGLPGLAIGFAAGQVLSFVWAWALMRRHAPLLRIRPLAVDRQSLRQMLSLGGRFQLLAFGNTALTEGLKFVISIVVDVRAVAAYDLCDKLVMLSRSVITAVIAPMMPAFAHLQAGNEVDKERRLMIRATRVGVLAGALSLVFVAVLAEPILLAWTGEYVPLAVVAIRVVLIGDLAVHLTGMMSANTRARGMIGPEMQAALVSGTVFVGVLVPLARMFEFTGLVWTRSLAGLAFAGWYLRFSRLVSGLNAFQYLRASHVHRIALLAVVCAAAVVAGRALLGDWLGFVDAARWRALVDVMVWSIPYGLLAAVGSWWYVLEENDRAALAGLVQARRRRRAVPPPNDSIERE